MSTIAKLREIRVREGFNSRTVLPEIPKLAADIEERGQLEAITVRDCSNGIHKPAHYYTVIFGHRRLAALQHLREEKRSAPVRKIDCDLTAFVKSGVYMQLVNDDFPVRIEIVDMSDEDAYLANLAENAHKEGMRTVDVYARCDCLLKEGYDAERVSRAAGISHATMTKRMSTFRRLAPEIVKRWQSIERPEHEPPWSFLADVARGKTTPGKRGGDVASRLVPAPTHDQLTVWEKLFGTRDSVVRVTEPAWRERHHLRPVREVRRKIAELKQRDQVERNHGAIDALRWVLGEDVEF